MKLRGGGSGGPAAATAISVCLGTLGRLFVLNKPGACCTEDCVFVGTVLSKAAARGVDTSGL